MTESLGFRPPAPGTRGRLIVVDDHRLVAAGLCALLAQEFEIVGVAHDGDQVLEMLKARSADCVLLDLMLPGTNGLELIPTICRFHPDTRIIVVTMLRDRLLADACVQAGASGFVPKDCSTDEMTTAIREVLAGRRFVSPRVPPTGHRVCLDARHLALVSLTPRQQEIVILLGEGRSYTDISSALGVGQSTITFHKKNIMRTLGIKEEAALYRFAALVGCGEAGAVVAGVDRQRPPPQ